MAETFAFIIYFAFSIDVVNIVFQLYKLILDLSLMFGGLPVIAWVLIGLIIFDHMRKKIGYSLLRHMEAMNCGFIKSLCIVVMLVGTMGKKKTTIVTDMDLSCEVIFRDTAFEKILENDLKFPHFPWINLEMELRTAVEYHQVYNLATVKRFVDKKQARWTKQPCKEKLFGYDYEQYGLFYDNKLFEEDIWSVVKTYAQLYFIYVIESSLMVSNYSVRTDALIDDVGNFPLWNSDFFQRDSRLIDSFSRHAHILDFDSLRLGKQLVEDGRYSNSFEFGVVSITEIGKERGNNLENQGKKKNCDDANQNNDLFNYSLKMARHKATVDNFPFIKILTDEQRPESWGADARDLCEIVHIDDCSDMELAMPFFGLEEMLYTWLFGKFQNVYTKYRFYRGDNTLAMHLIKTVMTAIQNHYKRIYNQFGYMKVNLQVEQGTQDGGRKDKKYYLMSKKIYSRRFSTDCFSEVFAEKSMRSPVGLNDLPEFATEKASFDEMLSENSYFFNDLAKIKDSDKRK
ncbi:MAG: hypothetical protein NC303_01085 [Firmicutes bacterium]|nr:hypothetical protein [Bacillota bacterium]MCM1393741.1 hypothetical protein [[Eubacterium] siraeum]